MDMVAKQFMEIDHPIVLYDGICNLCNRSIQFILRHEADNELRFVSQQSDLAQRLMAGHKLQQINSIIFWESGRFLTKSDAAIAIMRHLRPPYRWLSLVALIPKRIRDRAYELVAKLRYRIFGKSDHCQVPSEATRSRFLDL